MAKRKMDQPQAETSTETASVLKLDSTDIESPFPRGGGTGVAPLEIRQATAQATKDVYDEMSKSKKKKSKTKTSKAPAKTPKLPPRAELFAISKLRVGTLALGQIAEIHDDYLVISLPNNAIGFVQDTDTSLYKVGEWLRCIIAGVGQGANKRLQLLVDPQLVNQAIVKDDYIVGMSVQGKIKSKEDRGYVVDIAGGKAFLPLKEAEGDLPEGKVILTTILKDKSSIFTLTQRDCKPLETVHEQASLVPGVKVAAYISEQIKGGFLCSVFGHIDVTVDLLHKSDDAAENVTSEARILFSHPPANITQTDRTIALTMLDSAVKYTSPADSKAFKLGQVIDVAKVLGVSDNGLYLDIGVTRPAFVHISKVEDDHVEDLSANTYKPGTVHKGRIISYSYADDTYYLSLQPKVLAQKYLKIEEVEIGDVCEGTVDRFLSKGGLIISLGDGLKGICPEYYLSDVPLLNPQKKFKVGQKITARVLSTNPEQNKLKLAVKKSIVNAETEFITDYPEIGTKSLATIVALKDRGAVVEFMNDLKGFLPINEMSESKITDPKAHFKLGQTVSINVLDSDPDTDRIIVSCRVSRSNADGPQPSVLDVVTAVVSEKLSDAYSVQINGHVAVLPFELLADNASEVKAAKKSIKIGGSVKVLVLQNGYPNILTTMKSELIDNKPPTDLNTLSRGEKIHGYVRNVDEHGVFVAFANQLVALMPKTIVGSHEYVKGETVSVYVSKVDLDNKRLFVSPEGAASNGDKKKVTDGPQIGEQVTAVVTSVKQTQLNVAVDGVRGRIEVTQLFDSIDDIEDVKDPLGQFNKGDKIKAYVIGYHDTRNHKLLTTTPRSSPYIILELSTFKGGLREEFEEGSSVLAFINNFNDAKDSVFVNITPTVKARLALPDLTSDIDELQDVEANFPIGRAIKATVYSSSPVKISAVDESESIAIIYRVQPTLLNVRLSHDKRGLVAATDALDTYKPLKASFKEGQIVSSKVLEVDESNDKIWVSLQSSSAKDKSVTSAGALKTGDVVKGYIKNVADGGVFVQLGHNVTGRVQIAQLSDKYLKDWKKDFKVGEVVEAKVVSKSSANKIELTLKRSLITGKEDKQPGLEDLDEGSNYSGTIRSIQKYGIFVDLDGTSLSGLCHHSEVADKPIADLAKVFNVGDTVKVKVLEVDQEKRRISLGMKASYFGEDSEDEEGSESEMDVEEDAEDAESSNDEDVMEVEDYNEIRLPSDSEDESDSDDEKPATGDGLSAGFDWNADILDEGDDSDSSESDSDDEGAPRKRKRGEKFVEDKTATLNTRAPQSAQDFERLLVANPDSSVLWMNYMAFQLQLSEIDAAREIARRALKTIPVCEEEEKRNIWIALLNLENSFGTEETTLDTFKEACNFMDPLTMHEKMAGIYASSDKNEDADRTWNAACKKYGADNALLWVHYGKFLYGNGQHESARKLLERATRVLPTRDHKDLTVQFAKLEYTQGDTERARTLMEGLVSAFPRKIDIWNVYVDQEIKVDANREAVTRLFERILKLKLSTKQAKLFFKKWLSYEVERGDTKGVDYVKSKAQKYVNEN